MKPLMMMRTKGVTGPFATKHYAVPKMSKSAGNAVALGISAIIVPNVIGLPGADATTAIEAVGLVAIAVGAIDPVASQYPAAGANVAIGSDVTYTLTG